MRQKLQMRYVGIVVSAGLLGVVGCLTGIASSAQTAVTGNAASASAPDRPPGVTSKLPTSLVNVGEFGENIYDAAKAGNWTTAESKLRSLTDAVQQLRGDVPNAATGEDHLTSEIGMLKSAVAGRNRQGVMREANQVTLSAANISEQFNPQIPVNVTKLDYYGRELEVWAAAKNLGKLHSTAVSMSNTWDRTRPAVEAHGGAMQVQQFNSLITQLHNAATPSDYNKVAAALLESVDGLENVFKK